MSANPLAFYTKSRPKSHVSVAYAQCLKPARCKLIQRMACQHSTGNLMSSLPVHMYQYVLDPGIEWQPLMTH